MNTNRTHGTTFYLVESNNSTSNPASNISIENIYDFWNFPSSILTEDSETNSTNTTELVARTNVTSFELKPVTSSTTTTTTTTTPAPTTSSPTITTRNTTAIPATSTTLASVRLYSNIVPVRQAKKPRVNSNVWSKNEEPEETEPEDVHVVLHGTNMNSEELRMCNKSLVRIHLKRYSRRKVGKKLKKDLDEKFAKWNYRFSVVISGSSRNTMGKALHGVWLSSSVNGVHYFLTATHPVVDGPKLDEEQLSHIEYWAELQAIAAFNMTGYRKYNKIALKLKNDLDHQYGFGNVWSVIVVKNRYLVKAKVYEDPSYHEEFSRLNGGNFLVFRGGQNIDVTKRNARQLTPNVAAAASDDESSESSEFGEIIQ